MSTKNKIVKIEDYIAELNELHQYARANNFSEAERCFKTILDAFSGEKIKPDKAKIAIENAKKMSDKTEILSSFMSHKKHNESQPLYEKMKNFFAEHNKFEDFINYREKIDLKNRVSFFTPKRETPTLSSVGVIHKALGIKPFKK